MELVIGEVISTPFLLPEAKEIVPLKIVVEGSGYTYIDAFIKYSRALRINIRQSDLPAFKHTLEKGLEWCDVARKNNVKDVSKTLGKVGNMETLFGVDQKNKSCYVTFGAGVLELFFSFTGKDEMRRALDALKSAERQSKKNRQIWLKNKEKQDATEALFQ